jgi:hypothetical protein
VVGFSWPAALSPGPAGPEDVGRGRHERAQAGVDGEHVRPGQRPGQHAVGLTEYVVDVLGRGGGLGPVTRPVGVGGPDDPPRVPRDEEQHALARPHDHSRVRVDGGPRHYQVHALGHPHLVAGPHPARRVHQVRPDPRAHDHPGGAHVEGPPALLVPDDRAGHPGAVTQQRHGASARQHVRAVARGRPRHRHRVPRVVHLGVVVHHRAGEPLGPQRGSPAQRSPRGQVPVVRDGPLNALHRVIQHEPGPDVRPLDDLLVQRVEERHRPHQVRRQPADQQVTLPQGLLDELEVALLQVAEPAVDQLRRSRGRARRQVAGLDQTDPQAPRSGIERGARPGDPPADDQHVERPRGQRVDDRVTVTSVKNTRHGRQLLPGPSRADGPFPSIVSTQSGLVTYGLTNLR